LPLLVYGVSTATATLSCIGQILSTPIVDSNSVPGVSLTRPQRTFLLVAYAPWFLIPLLMTADMASRMYKLIAKGIQAEDAAKHK
jgi:hypothetical protein